MMFHRNYSAPPRQPFALPISSHPPAAPCGPGAQLPQGRYVSRGGVFEGAAMSQGESHCGYWSDYVGDVPLAYNYNHAPGNHPPSAHLRVVPSVPSETPSHFQPRNVNLGYPMPQNVEHAADAMGASDVPRRFTMAENVNRSVPVWTAPGARADWPQGMTPRGGVLDGGTLHHGRQLHAAYYGGDSPRVLMPNARGETIPNPIDRQLVPEVGWGVDGPEQQRRNYGAMEAQHGAPIRNSGVNGSGRATMQRTLAPGGGYPKPVAASVFGGRVPGGQIVSRSVFRTAVQAAPGPVHPVSTLLPATRSVPADASYAALGYSPDGIG